MNTDVIKVVFTGGPCAGKSTAIAQIYERFTKLGYEVAISTEAATALGNSGLLPSKYGAELFFQDAIFRKILNEEDLLVEILRRITSHLPRILLCDRGTMDGQAYTGRDNMNALFGRFNTSLVDMRDRRYDAVIHLVTAADGAEAFYTTENNKARHESPEEARELDKKTAEAWLGHQHVRMIDNSTDFAGKIDRACAEVAHVVGVPVPQEIERKFLVEQLFDLSRMKAPYETVSIAQLYHVGGARTRVRSQHGQNLCFHTIKNMINATTREEYEKIISHEEYIGMQHTVDPFVRPITKNRTCFFWEKQYFELDFFKERDLWLMEIELLHPDQKIVLPPFVPVVREVTDEESYSNYHMAKAS